MQPTLVDDIPIRTAEDLTRHVLLHDAHGTWPVFLERAGVHTDAKSIKSLKFSHTSLAIDAAIAGQGVALASDALLHDDIAAGRLLSPLDIRLRDDLGFYIVHPRAPRKPDQVRRLRDWLLGQAARRQ